MLDTVVAYVQAYFNLLLLFLPIGIIGAYRWCIWLVKRVLYLFYKPIKGDFFASVSIITPVYNEDTDVFLKALNSWVENRPKEIIAVVDSSDAKSIEVFKKFKATHFGLAHLIITDIPGKREALARGINASKSEFLALVDSDTIWDKDTLVNGIQPFANRKVGGVATRQNVLNPKTIAQKIFDIQLDQRYFEEAPVLALTNKVVRCFSGRTAFYRRAAVINHLDALVNEKFLGEKVISGDDKCLTYLILKEGWQAAYQSNSRVYTPGVESLRVFLKQRIRWTRNSWRADLKAIFQGWVFRHPVLAFFMLDGMTSPITILIGPIYFFLSLWFGLWQSSTVLLLWWFVSRTIKISPHLIRRPQDILVMPSYIAHNFLHGLVKIYALLTLNAQGWVTRWDASRLRKLTFIKNISAIGATGFVVLGLAFVITTYETGKIRRAVAYDFSNRSTIFIDESLTYTTNTSEVIGAVVNDRMLVGRYVVKEGDSINSIASELGVSSDGLLKANISVLPNWNVLEEGQVLNVPRSDLSLLTRKNYKHEIRRLPSMEAYYDNVLDGVVVTGRGNITTITEIAHKVGPSYIEELEPKVWLVKKDLYLKSGITLYVTSKDVNWLKLYSGDDSYAELIATDSRLVFENTKVTSWDGTLNDFDTNYSNGRAYILAKSDTRLDAYNSEFAHLGFKEYPTKRGGTYGVSWRIPDGSLGSDLVTGELISNKFHDNYFGAYTYGATSMVWRENEFYDNVQYGLDPHDDSNFFLVENNTFRNNGNHGLIFSKRCIGNMIRNNLSYENKLHGIMLHAKSNFNTVINNTVYGNVDGISVYDSGKNLIKNNNIYNNVYGVKLNNNSKFNTVLANTLSYNKNSGIFAYNNSDENSFIDNKFFANLSAIYLKSKSNVVVSNQVQGGDFGLYFADTASENRFITNTFSKVKRAAIYPKTVKGYTNISGKNTYVQNGFNIKYF